MQAKNIKPFGKSFFAVDVVTLAKELLGKIIVRKMSNGNIIKVMIVETEAYKAPEDKACHAYNNKKTDRTKYFWTEGGHLYIFSIYGNNYCLNIVAGKETEPEAVLLRAVEPIEGIEYIRENRKTAVKKTKYAKY
jgi:DNA-3-methyladenine glycosylase